jgi:hypothetical protein
MHYSSLFSYRTINYTNTSWGTPAFTYVLSTTACTVYWFNLLYIINWNYQRGRILSHVTFRLFWMKDEPVLTKTPAHRDICWELRPSWALCPISGDELHILDWVWYWNLKYRTGETYVKNYVQAGHSVLYLVTNDIGLSLILESHENYVQAGRSVRYLVMNDIRLDLILLKYRTGGSRVRHYVPHRM